MDGEIPDDIKCPVCFEIPDREIFQCKNGHTVCAECSETLRECPQCRVPYEAHKIRNRALESLMDTMKFNCIYKSEGCHVKAKRQELSNHIDVCSYGSTQIALCGHLGYSCGYLTDTKKINEILAHFVTSHDFTIRHETNLDVCLDDALYLNRSLESIWTPVVMNPSLKVRVTLLLINRFNPKDQTVSFTCINLDDPNSDRDVHMKFTIRAKTPNKTPDIMWTTPCVNIKHAEFALRKHIFQFPVEFLLKHYVRDSAIVINCSMEQDEKNEFKTEAPEETIWTFNVTASTSNAAAGTAASSSSSNFSMPPTRLPSSQQLPRRCSPPPQPLSSVACKSKPRSVKHGIALFGTSRNKSNKEKACKHA